MTADLQKKASFVISPVLQLGRLSCCSAEICVLLSSV